MGRRKTILIIILSMILASLVAATAALGVAMARSSFSDDTGAVAGEARWSVGIGEYTGSAGIGIYKMMPDYVEYSGTQRSKETFGVVAVLENAGEVTASVAVTDGGEATINRDGCGSVNENRYSDDDVWEHISCELYYYTDDKLTFGDYKNNVAGKLSSGTSFTLDAGDSVYIYAHTTWTTDLDYDISDKNHVYDGALGDEFDTWAGQHLLGITFHVDIECVQAE